jgi:DHA1 family multidrug resistance protein-like MFS transporter
MSTNTPPTTQPQHDPFLMQTDVESQQPHERRRNSTSSSVDPTDEKDNHDGHCTSLRDIQQTTSRSRSRPQVQTTGGTTTALNQPLSRTLSRRETVLSKVRSRPNIPPFSHPLAHVPTTEDVLVDFDGPEDPYLPLNWPTHKKVLTTVLYGLCTMTATWASSSYSAGNRQIAREFHVGTQVATLGTTLFLFGFGLGPLLWAPLSEVYGRKVAVLAPLFVAACFSFGSATAKDFQTLMITRFFGAFFASAPVTNTGGVLGDLYDASWRGIAMAGYAMAVVGGPCIGK